MLNINLAQIEKSTQFSVVIFKKILKTLSSGNSQPVDTDGSRICKRECWTYSIRLTELAFRRAANSKSQKLSTFIATQTSQFVVLPQWAPLLPTAGFTVVAILTEKDRRRNDQSANGKIDQR